jgi:predicted AlkP superfamily phosphohydrolase/phosphomutase
VTLHSFKKVFDRLGPLQHAYRIIPKAARDRVVTAEWRTTDLELDWSQTRAYAGSDNGTQIYLNVQGREPAGIVRPGAEYEALREEIAHALEREFAARTAPPRSIQVYRREDIYGGPYLDDAPDLIVYADNGSWEHDTHIHPTSFRPFAPGQKVESGSHRPLGLFILSGGGIRPQEPTATAHILDLAPTILHLLGLPIPEDFDGRPLLEHLSFQRDALYSPTVAFEVVRREYSPTEEATVEQRLRDLGYL